jgi:hypothetical protein
MSRLPTVRPPLVIIEPPARPRSPGRKATAQTRSGYSTGDDGEDEQCSDRSQALADPAGCTGHQRHRVLTKAEFWTSVDSFGQRPECQRGQEGQRDEDQGDAGDHADELGAMGR